MLIYSSYKRIDNDLFTLYSNILLRNDRYLIKNRYLCNTNKRNYKNKTFQGIIIKKLFMKATEVVERLKQRFPNEPEYIQAVSQVLDTIEDEYNKILNQT